MATTLRSSGEPPKPPAPPTPTSTGAAGPVRTAGRATLLVMAFVLLSRVLGVVRSMALGNVFGQNATTDIYIRAFAVPDMIYLLMAGGALSTVFVPVFTKYTSDGDESGAWQALGRIATLVGVVVAGVILVFEIAAPWLARLAAPAFSDTAVAQMVPMIRILLPAQWFFFVGGLLIATLQARGRFFIASLGPIIYNAAIIAGALSQAGRPNPDVSAMTWGALIGAGAGNFLLPLWDLLRSGGRIPLGLDLKHPGVRRFLELLLPAMLGLGLSQLGFLITGFFLGEGGALSALRNGYELTQAPIGIFAQASAIVLFPAISLLAAKADWPAFRREVHHGIRRILFLTVPASLLMSLLAEPIIRTLWPRFSAQEVADAADALRLYSIGTFAWSAQAVLGRGFFAQQDTKTPLAITKFMIVLFTALCAISTFVLHAGLIGLALSMSVVAMVSMGAFLAALARKVGDLDIRAMTFATLRIFAAATISTVVAFFALDGAERLLPLSSSGRGGALVVVVTAGLVGIAAYAVACLLLRVPELKTVRALFRRSPAAAAPAASASDTTPDTAA
mgnify:CR=1 FL=1